ncbi:hypothetical protein AUC68_06945 [Methyloceanibacter methanicus]|uniref:Uncharacterized protein n=1 Tax=Methyloceanibacter methanicus TaxID=1774968 RepID=A0A1E3VZC3_9HYPH|nr:hypothetical protein [Methyloceanibacter methanicus]ODR98904.1 hypothetical protein AUC68_06945 [Methyloceanibacter methanicus]
MTDQTAKTDDKTKTDAEMTVQADKEWDDLQRELETLGDQVRSLREHAGALGETVLGNMELRFQDVLSRAHAYRNTTATQMETLQKLAVEQAGQTQATLTETGKKSAEMAKDKARELWDRAEPLRQGAQEVGQGFLRAWSEIAASFGKAAEKVQSDKPKETAENETSKTTENQPS